MRGRVLLVDDDPQLVRLVGAKLRAEGFAVVPVESARAALAEIDDDGALDVVVTDLDMPEMDGLSLCERVTANRPDLPVVVVTAHGRLETAVAAIRVGAYDFVTKPIEFAELFVAVDRAVQHRRLRDEVKRLRDVVAATQRRGDLLGESAAMHKVYEMLDRVADLESSVLVVGESGTGKELVARALHERSRRRAAPFVAINCAAIPEALLESELFGHAKGAFTDARASRAGLFAQADGGTLFLDEVGELPLALQPKLLRALQDRVVRPVGADREVPFDARIVAATNRDLETLVEEKRFREDLYYRLNVIQVDLPPLRARGNDVLLLAQHFVDRFAARAARPVAGISPEAAERLTSYSWPGNVRELQNCVERAVALTRYEKIAVDDLPDKVRNYRPSHVVVASNDPTELVTMEEVERRYILRVLEAAGGSRTQAAKILGLDRKTLYRKLARYDAESKGTA